MEFSGFSHVALWTRPGAPFLCLEAWTGYSDPEGFAGELLESRGMRVLEPARAARHAARFRLPAGVRTATECCREELSDDRARPPSCSTAKHAEGVLARVAEEARGADRARREAGSGGGAGRRGSREPGLCRAARAGRRRSCGFHSVQHDLPAETSEAELLALVERLNADPAIHGILVQLPLPKTINAARVLEAIAPHKDVDGFHPDQRRPALDRRDAPRARALHAGGRDDPDRPGLRALGRTLAGKEAVIIGRSNIVGKPMAQLLLARNCTVTIAHSRTRDLPAVARRADILVAAVGRPEMVRGDWMKPGAIVIDVGINRVAGRGLDAAGKPKTRLVGDVAYAEAAARAGAITPVPGGVGPMTIAMLMANTLIAAKRERGAAAGVECLRRVVMKAALTSYFELFRSPAVVSMV